MLVAVAEGCFDRGQCCALRRESQIQLCKRLLACGCLLPTHHCCVCVVCVAQMDQFFFMADRHDPSFCCVRYMTDVRLREWKVYLQPVAKRECLLTCVLLKRTAGVSVREQRAWCRLDPSVWQQTGTLTPCDTQRGGLSPCLVLMSMAAGFMSKVPDEAMANLQKTLNVAGSPVYSSEFEEVYRQEQRSASSSKASSRSGSKANSRGGTTSDRPSSNGTSRSGLSSGWLKNMFTGGGSLHSFCVAAAAVAFGQFGVWQAVHNTIRLR